VSRAFAIQLATFIVLVIIAVELLWLHGSIEDACNRAGEAAAAIGDLGTISTPSPGFAKPYTGPPLWECR
jgi:hypothetical protein